MFKLDRQGWTCGFSFQAYGARFAVRSNDAELLEQLRAKLPPGARDDPARAVVDVLISARRGAPPARPGLRNFHLLHLSITQVVRSETLEDVIAAFENQIHLLVAAFARRCVFIHAGCVGWQGRAILVPGQSMAGKSTLVHALVQAGADYLSDEYAVIDPRGRVHPYLKTISMRGAPGTTPRRLSAEEVGGRAAQAPLPVGLVASLRYATKAGTRWQTLSPAAAVMELLANTVAVRRNPELSLALIQRALTGARAIKGRRGDAKAVVPKLLRLAAATPEKTRLAKRPAKR